MSSVRNGIYGLCVADALGVPAESRTRADLEQNPITEMVGGGIHGQPSGYWSDDSSMTLCLADSIGQVGYYHTHDIMARFDDWCCNGAYSPGGKRFDIGNTCAWAIDRYQKGVTPALCGSNKMNENGNGSLMRILPMAFVLYQKYGIHITGSKRAMEDIHKISGLTHRHPLAQSACGVYLAIALRILDGFSLKNAIREGTQDALQWYSRHERFQIVLNYWERIAAPDDLAALPKAAIYSGGFVVETMETALWALMNTDSYRECVLTCVNMGYDADSTAAVAGGLAGLYYGYNSIPAEWVNALAAKEIIEECIQSLENWLGITLTLEDCAARMERGGGDLNLSNTQITNLPDNLTVGRNLNLCGTPIAALPDNLTINGSLNLSFTQITVLPSNLTVNGSLDLSFTQITVLPSDLTVGKSLHLDHTQITALPDDLIVNGSLDLSFSQITALPSNLTVSKSLHLNHTQITALPDRLTVGSSLTLRNTQITTLPDYLAVGGRLFLNDAQIPDAEL